MRRIFDWSSAGPVRRNLTVADLRAAKGGPALAQVTANTEEEAEAAREAGIDMLVCNAANVAATRKGAPDLFLTAAIPLVAFPTADDVLREAFRAMGQGADAVFTQRGLEIVSMLAREDIPVTGHLGLVPRKSTWIGGLRAYGRTEAEARDLMRRFRDLESAGACLVEVEVVPAPILAAISPRTGLVTVSLGSGGGGDVVYLFMRDICGEDGTRPRHARAYGDLLALRSQMQSERVRALQAFRADVASRAFPSAREDVGLDQAQLDAFLDWLDRGATPPAAPQG